MPLLPQTKPSQQRLQQASNAAAATNYTIPIAAAAGHQCRCCHHLDPPYRACSMPAAPLLPPVRPYQQWWQKASNAPLQPQTEYFQQLLQQTSNAADTTNQTFPEWQQQASNAAATTNYVDTSISCCSRPAMPLFSFTTQHPLSKSRMCNQLPMEFMAFRYSIFLFLPFLLFLPFIISFHSLISFIPLLSFHSFLFLPPRFIFLSFYSSDFSFVPYPCRLCPSFNKIVIIHLHIKCITISKVDDQ